MYNIFSVPPLIAFLPPQPVSHFLHDEVSLSTTRITFKYIEKKWRLANGIELGIISGLI